MRKYLKKYGKESRHNVISRKDNLILSPDRPAVVAEEESIHPKPKTGLPSRLMKGENVSVATLQREFEMDDVLDYLKTGIAAIIEDEVTQRFVAEELKVGIMIAMPLGDVLLIRMVVVLFSVMEFAHSNESQL